MCFSCQKRITAVGKEKKKEEKEMKKTKRNRKGG